MGGLIAFNQCVSLRSCVEQEAGELPASTYVGATAAEGAAPPLWLECHSS